MGGGFEKLVSGNMNFVALDVETANADMASICQIGAAKFVDGRIVDEWKDYINPKDYFDAINTSIHGIDEGTIKDALLFPDLFPAVIKFVGDSVVVTHTHFDRVAIHQAACKYKILAPAWTWLDSARVVRRTWPEFSSRGYGLSNVCKVLDIKFQHHDALEDAKAAGQVLLKAINESQLDIDNWLSRVHHPIGTNDTTTISRDGNPNGPLFGEVIVFTGSLDIPRREAADMAAEIGCAVGQSVTKKTTILVVGDQDVTMLAGEIKSAKHRKAEKLVPITGLRILRETDFRELVHLSSL